MKRMRLTGLAVLVTLVLLSMPGQAGHAKETLSPEWVTALPAAAKTEQLIVVGGVGKTTAWISMHEKEKDGRWHQIMTTPGFIGREGLGKEKEGDWKSPAGTFRFNKAFGIARDPGCAIPYTQVDKNTYWSGDQRPGMEYDRMVDIRNYPTLDKENSEHIIDYKEHYQYCLNINYNHLRVPGKDRRSLCTASGRTSPLPAAVLPCRKTRCVT